MRSRRSRFDLSSDASPPRPRMLLLASATHASASSADPCGPALGLATRRCIGRVAPAVWVMRRPLFRAAFRYPHAGHVAWSGPFRRRSVLGFPSRDQLLRATGDLACLAHRTRVTRVTVLLSTLFPDGTRGVSDVRALRRFAPARRMRRCFQRREPTCRSPIHPSQWFRCAIGRPGSMQGAPVVVPRFERRASSAAKRWE
jgi:hypothetical protein